MKGEKGKRLKKLKVGEGEMVKRVKRMKRVNCEKEKRVKKRVRRRGPLILGNVDAPR